MSSHLFQPDMLPGVTRDGAGAITWNVASDVLFQPAPVSQNPVERIATAPLITTYGLQLLVAYEEASRMLRGSGAASFGHSVWGRPEGWSKSWHEPKSQHPQICVWNSIFGETHLGAIAGMWPELITYAWPSTIPRGTPSILFWEARYADNVWISQGIGLQETQGMLPVAPRITTEYVVLAIGRAGVTGAIVVITVFVAPPSGGDGGPFDLQKCFANVGINNIQRDDKGRLIIEVSAEETP